MTDQRTKERFDDWVVEEMGRPRNIPKLADYLWDKFSDQVDIEDLALAVLGLTIGEWEAEQAARIQEQNAEAPGEAFSQRGVGQNAR